MHSGRIGQIILFVPLEEEEQNTHAQMCEGENTWAMFGKDNNRVFDIQYVEMVAY